MSRIPIVLAVAVMLGLMLVAATAQTAEPDDEAAEPPSAEMNVLFAHGTGEDEFLGFMNTLEEDGDDETMGSGQFSGGAKTWTFHLEPNLTTGLILDAEETIDVYAYIGGTQGGRLTVTTQVSSGDDVLATGEGKAINLAGSYQLLTWNMDVLNDTIHPDTNLTWTVRASGVATGASLGVGGDRMSNVTLPIIGDAGGNGSGIMTTYADVSTVNINETLEFENATDARYQFNWSMEEENGVSGELMVEGAGNVSLTALDGNGTEVVNVNATGETDNSSASGGSASTGNNTGEGNSIPLDAPDAEPGYWMVNVTISNFTGTLILSLGPAVETLDSAEDPNATTATANRPPRTSAAATTAAASETAEGRGIPGVATIAAFAALSFAAFAWRRRRA